MELRIRLTTTSGFDGFLVSLFPSVSFPSLFTSSWFYLIEDLSSSASMVNEAQQWRTLENGNSMKLMGQKLGVVILVY